MRSAGNFSPEWGYLAPAPSFARTARVVLVATAIGATAGAGVVLSLIDRPGEPEKTPIAARAIVTGVRAAAVPTVAASPAPTAAPVTVSTRAKPASPPASVAAAPPERSSPPASVSANTSSPNAAPPVAPSAVAPDSAAITADTGVTGPAPATASASDASDSTDVMAPEQAAPAKKAKRHASSNKNAQYPGIGSIFRRMFASHGNRSYYPNSQ